MSSGSGVTTRTTDPAEERELVVVSNRQPYRHTYGEDGTLEVDRPAGGLTAGLDPAVREAGGTWIAWGDGDGDRDAVDSNDEVAVPPEDPGYSLRRVWLTEAEERDYYLGYSNQVLWPVCHATLGNVRCAPGFWERYREVNERFADVVLERAGPGSLVWLQDYHLALVAGRVRSRRPAGPSLAHFWHVPWPEPGTFRACPHARELLSGLLRNDVLGFHVPRYRANFLRCVDAALDGARVDWEANRVHYDGSATRVEALPMGVEVERIERRASSDAAAAAWADFTGAHGIDDGTRVALGVDRLDYTKGVPSRLEALERLWERYPERRGEFTYVQSACESRSEIPAYRAVQEAVDAAVGRINDRFGTDDWRPVVYTTEWLSREELCGLYRHADLAIVSPIRDGMNLVAQEYVAARSDGDGVLVLSEGAGAHDVLGRDALSVSPVDVEGVAETIEAALRMSPAERRRRMAGLRRRVADIDLSSWTDAFLARAAERAGTTAPARPP